MKRPSFDDLAAFIEVARHNNFRKAASNMGVTRSALSHTIKSLEKRVGRQLFRRTTRSVSITDDGKAFLKDIGPLLDSLDSAIANIANNDEALGGELRINGSEAGIRLLLNSITPTFSLDHPNIRFDLVSDGTLTDIVAEGFDAGIRLAENLPQDMIGLPLQDPIRFVAVASPTYLSTNGSNITHPNDLKKHVCIRQRLPSGARYTWEFSKRGINENIQVDGPISLDNNQLMLEMAIAARGIAYLPEFYVQAAIKSGELVLVLDKWCPFEPGLHLYYTKNSFLRPELKAFINHIKKLMPAMPLLQ